jgi:glycosyltransferase involved in cell wall biosynthesis
MRALAWLREAHGLRIPLVASGRQTEFFPELERMALELGVADSIQWLGFVDPTDVQVLYARARAVIIPTRFEAASAPLWEAFLAGVPAACSNVTSLPDQAGDAALVFDPDNIEAMGEAVRRLWLDEALRTDLIAAGRARVQEFTWERTARLFRAHYRRIAGRELNEEDRYLLAGEPPI